MFWVIIPLCQSSEVNSRNAAKENFSRSRRSSPLLPRSHELLMSHDGHQCVLPATTAQTGWLGLAALKFKTTLGCTIFCCYYFSCSKLSSSLLIYYSRCLLQRPAPPPSPDPSKKTDFLYQFLRYFSTVSTMWTLTVYI